MARAMFSEFGKGMADLFGAMPSLARPGQSGVRRCGALQSDGEAWSVAATSGLALAKRRQGFARRLFVPQRHGMGWQSDGSASQFFVMQSEAKLGNGNGNGNGKVKPDKVMRSRALQDKATQRHCMVL